MKTLSKSIIFILAIFSIPNFSFAAEDYIEKLFDFEVGVERRELDLAEIKYQNIQSAKYFKIQNSLREVHSLIKIGIIKNYKNGEYGYYQTQGIVTNYNNFIYYTNTFFYFLKQKEYYTNDTDINDAILKSYKNMKIYYTKVKNLTTKRGLN